MVAWIKCFYMQILSNLVNSSANRLWPIRMGTLARNKWVQGMEDKVNGPSKTAEGIEIMRKLKEEGVVPMMWAFAEAQQMENDAEDVKDAERKKSMEADARKLKLQLFEAINSLAGQGVYGCNDVPSVKALVERTVQEASDIFAERANHSKL